MCNECNCLSVELRKLGFFMVYGQIELPCSGISVDEYKDLRLIGKQDPKTYDYNNGTYVVCDEDGYPWVIDGSNHEMIQKLKKDFCLEKGAGVPHSNDGGTYNKLLYALRAREEAAAETEKQNKKGD